MNSRRQIDRCESQRALMDNLEPDRIGEINVSLGTVRTALANNAQQLQPLLHQIAAIGDELAKLGGSDALPPPPSTLSEDAAEVFRRAHIEKSLREGERRAVAGVWQLLHDQASELTGLLSRLRDQTPALYAGAAGRSPNRALVQQAHRTFADCTHEVTQILGVAAERIARALSDVEQTAAELRRVHDQQAVSFQGLVKQHQAAGDHTNEPSPREPPPDEFRAKQAQLARLQQQGATLQVQRDRLLVVQSELLDERFRVRCQAARQPANRPCPNLASSLVSDLTSLAGS